VPTNAKASSTSVSTGAIDPNSTTSDFTVHTYGIEGVVHVGATDGTLRLIVDDTGDASTNDIEMAAESYIVLTEID
jgi:predicted TIM-barrel enzyme